MAPRLALQVTADAQRMLRSGHPWIYDRAIRRQKRDGAPGDLAVIYDERNRFLAVGLYDPASPIRVRILQHHRPATIDAAWFTSRIVAAAALRKPLGAQETTGYRLIHGENDGLPGLVVDRYADVLVVKLYTAAWAPHLPLIVAALRAACPALCVVLRLARVVQEEPQHLRGLADGLVLAGALPKELLVFEEHGLRFYVDVVHGHKTGFFLDQRENRARVARLCSGRTVLDVFAYTGAFSVHAARGGAREVTSLDASGQALATAMRNMALNRHHASVARAKHALIEGDAFQTLTQFNRSRRRFDLVILDPPAFATTQRQVPAALRAYERLALAGLGALRPGGILVASSCSGHIGADAFFAAVHRAASAAKRPLRELERTGHPLDHPIRFPEGAYLKCLFAVAA